MDKKWWIVVFVVLFAAGALVYLWYSWLHIPPSLDCQDYVSVALINSSCRGGVANLTFQNKGLWNLSKLGILIEEDSYLIDKSISPSSKESLVFNISKVLPGSFEIIVTPHVRGEVCPSIPIEVFCD